TRTAEEQTSTSADEDVGTPPTTRNSLGPARQETEDLDFQPRRSPRKHSSDRGCDNRAS
ncbi:unnamed protein product, partial [Ascophyllum nodosum]